MHSSKFGTVMPSGISTMPCHGVHRKENNRYRHLERSHGSLSNTKGVCNKKTANEFKCHFTNICFCNIYLYRKKCFWFFFRPNQQWNSATTNSSNNHGTILFIVMIWITNHQVGWKNPNWVVPEEHKLQPLATMAQKCLHLLEE